MSVRATTLLILALWAAAPALAQTYVGVIDPEGTPTLHDLDWRDGALYATDTNPDRILRIDATTGAVVVQGALSFDPRGLAWDGTNYRVSTGFDTSNPEIFTVSPTGTSLGSVPSPTALANGLTFFDGLLWVAKAHPDPEASIVGINPATGAVVETIPFPSTQPTGIAFLGDGTLWASNAGDDSGSSGVYRLYHIERATGTVLGTLDGPPGTTRTRGLAYDGSRFLYVTVREGTPQQSLIYKIDLQQSGNAVAAVSPDSLDFGVVAQNSSAIRTLTIGNTGDAPLVIQNVEITGQILGGGSFSTTLASGTTVPPGGQITPTVTFTGGGPSSLPTLNTATLRFTTNDVNLPQAEVPLRGYNAFPNPTPALSATSHDFGPVRVDGQNLTVAVWPLVITNTGAQPLVLQTPTSTNPAFGIYSPDFPQTVAPAGSVTVEVFFRPAAAGPASATLSFPSNAAATPTLTVQGTGIVGDPDGGTLVWQHDVPANPATSSNDRKVFALVSPGDLTGDGQADLVYAARNYWTIALDADSDVQPPGTPGPAPLWQFSSCPNNNNCGAVSSGSSQLFETGIAVADLSGDGVLDIVIGTEGGNDHVYALNGATGALLWGVGSDTDPFLASYYSVSTRPGMDATGDGVPDVATGTGSASAQSPNPFNHRRVYFLSGADGAIVWDRSTPFPNFRTTLYRSTDGLRVASVGGESGQNGLIAWRAPSGAVAFSATPSVSPFLAEPVPSAACAGCEDLLVAGLGSGVTRFNGETGAEIWTAIASGSSVWDVAVVNGATPLVVVGTTSSQVQAFDAATGAAAWQVNLIDQVFAVETVADSDGDGVEDVAAAGKGGVAVLLSGATGAELWRYTFGDGQFPTSGEDVTSVPDLDGDGAPEIAVGTRDGRILLLYGGRMGTAGEATPGALTGPTLDAPFPNPSAGEVTLRYRLPEAARVRLSVVDALGREVWSAPAAEQGAGSYALPGPTGLAAGLYVVRLAAGGTVATRRLSVVR